MSSSIRAHFDGQNFVPDEPVIGIGTGEKLRVTIEREAPQPAPGRPSLRGIAKGWFTMSDDFNAPLDCFGEYQQ